MGAIFSVLVSLALVSASIAGAGNEKVDVDALNRQIRERLERTEKRDVGSEGSANFTVLAPPNTGLAQKVLDQAELYRKEIALKLLGNEIPVGTEFAHIQLRLDPTKDEGLTLLAGEGRELPGDNYIWIKSTPTNGTGSTLKHEITHIVLAHIFSGATPPWANEGIASLADDDARRQIRRQVLADMVRRGTFPTATTVFSLAPFRPSEREAYTSSTLLVEFLLSRNPNHQTLIRFIADTMAGGTENSLLHNYNLKGLDDLNREFRQWAHARAAL